jgi:cytochrome c553
VAGLKEGINLGDVSCLKWPHPGGYTDMIPALAARMHALNPPPFGAISLVTASPLQADDLPVRNCTWCHGTSAQGYSKAPRLAGQRVDYLVNQR